MDQILTALNQAGVDYLLVGGMNFLLRHQPELTFDVDVWVRDTDSNLERLNQALRSLSAEWGPTERDWKSVPEEWHWLKSQTLFCLTTAHGALDVFRQLRGLENRYEECFQAASRMRTASGIEFWSMSDEHMLASQEALPVEEQKPRRIQVLRQAIHGERR